MGDSNVLLTYHVDAHKDFMSFEPHIPQYKKLKNGEFTSLTHRMTHGGLRKASNPAK